MARTNSRSIAGGKIVTRSAVTGKKVIGGTGSSKTTRSVTGSASTGRSTTTGRFVSGSFARGTKMPPVTDVDVVGAVRLTTPQQVDRLGKLKQRIDAEMKHRGMRDSA